MGRCRKAPAAQGCARNFMRWRSTEPAMTPALRFSRPTLGRVVPDHQVWVHEIKYDGYRTMLLRDGAGVRLLTKGGFDWARRYPLIVEAALALPAERFVLDGETVVLDA